MRQLQNSFDMRLHADARLAYGTPVHQSERTKNFRRRDPSFDSHGLIAAEKLVATETVGIDWRSARGLEPVW
jgi:hypothetical protein